MKENDYADTDWRIENLYKITNKSGQRVVFKPNNIQRTAGRSKSKRKIYLKSRQVGISTYELIRQTDFVLNRDNVTACILAHEDDAIAKLFRIPRKAYNYLHEELKPDLAKGGGSKYEMYFPANNSRIYCDLESRGETIHWLHVSEMAFVKEPDRVKATIESVPIDGIVTIESTPNGLNHFYDLYMDGDSNYEKLFFPWFMHEEYRIQTELTASQLTDLEKEFIKKAKRQYGIDISLPQIAFRRFKQRELKEMFKQEYPEDDATCFLTSGNNPFTLEIIKPLYDQAPRAIREVNGIRIYEEKKNDELYVVSADTAEGVEGDRSAAHVFKVSTRTVVASFASGSIKPSEFAEKLVEMAAMYKPKFKNSPDFWPLLGVERNNHGHAVLLKLDEILHYQNLFKMDRDSDKYGWITDKATRPIMINALIEAVENSTAKLVDKETLGECLTLVNRDGKIEAEDGKKDDLFIAACIGLQLCIQESRLGIYSNVGSSIKI